MKKIRDSPQDIETIIHSFTHYALTDIRHARERPIAAFILSICFIDRPSTFLYKFKDADGNKPEWFFRDYMEEYKGINYTIKLGIH